MLLKNQFVRLRAVEPEDLEFLFHCENDTQFWEVSHTLVPYSRFVLKQYIADAQFDIFTQKQLRLIIETVSFPEKVVGAIDLFDFDPFHSRAGVGIVICSEENRKLGLATNALNLLIEYCFNRLMLKQLYCNISPDNVASLNLFQNAGFEKCGEKKSWINTANGWADEWMFQLINLNYH